VVTSGPIPYTNGPTNPNMPWVLRTWTSGHTQWVSYIPVSRFWPMQFVESGWLLALSSCSSPRPSGWSAAAPPEQRLITAR